MADEPGTEEVVETPVDEEGTPVAPTNDETEASAEDEEKTEGTV